MQTILGSGGSIGNELARALPTYTKDIRLVSRNPKKVNESDQLFALDLSDPDSIFKAIQGSEVVYVTIGFPYSFKAWKKYWPPFIHHVLLACEKEQSRLVFFDNIYMLDCKKLGDITEKTKVNPCSKKGKIRAAVDYMINKAVDKSKVEAIIARSPDFYGPVRENSVLMAMVFDNLIKKKQGQWLCNAKVPHSFLYTPDAGNALAQLGNTKDAFNQIWNLPVSQQTPTGEEWIELFAQHLNVSSKHMVIPAWGIKSLGIFSSIMREFYEMKYQYDRPYIFNSAKFNRRFKFSPTTPNQGVFQTIEALNCSSPT